jgi:hypothetical protein
METCGVERGKPHERETQNLVGAFSEPELNGSDEQDQWSCR